MASRFLGAIGGSGEQMSFLVLEVNDWILEVKTRGGGFQVSLIEANQSAVTHFVRLNRDQSETLRQFLNDASPPPSTHRGSE